MTVIGLTAFLPMYVQGVLRQSPLIAGLTLAVAIGRCIHRRISSIGSGARRSWSTNRIAATTILHEGVERRSRQIDALGAALFTAAIAALMIALTEATPIGRLIQKIHGQLRWPMIRPPTSGPATEEMPQTLAR
jgi:hypothetical protein